MYLHTGKLKVVNLSQYAKALYPIDEHDGKFTVVKLSQYANAPRPIVVTVLSVKLVIVPCCSMKSFGPPPPLPSYVPVTLVTQSSSVESPTLTTTSFAILLAERFVSKTPFTVCVPVRYFPLAIV